MDGVSGLTQAPIPPGGRFVYRLTPPDAGTFWAHAHHRTYEQLARGLYLPLIVDEAEPYAADRDQLLVLDDWRPHCHMIEHQAAGMVSWIDIVV